MTLTEKRSEFLFKIGLFLVRVSLLPEFHPETGHYWLIETCADRTAKEQNDLYQIGRTKKGNKVTNCDGYRNVSPHQRWCAKDFCLVDSTTGLPLWNDEAMYQKLGEIAEAFGLKWGGHWGDKGHFEL